MGDWFRSVTVLALAFVGAVVVTIGLANVIVPGGPSDPQAAAGGDDGRVAELGGGAFEGGQAGGVDAVVVGQKDAHWGLGVVAGRFHSYHREQPGLRRQR